MRIFVASIIAIVLLALAARVGGEPTVRASDPGPDRIILLPYDEAAIRKVAVRLRDEQGVKRAAPCHCTGPLAFKVFGEVYGESFELAGLGSEVTLRSE